MNLHYVVVIIGCICVLGEPVTVQTGRVWASSAIADGGDKSKMGNLGVSFYQKQG